MIHGYTKGEVRTALRRTRSWFKRNPSKWIPTKYDDGNGCFCLVGRFWKELCPDATTNEATTLLYGGRVYSKAHDVLVDLVKRLDAEREDFASWGNDIRFGRVSTINDCRLEYGDQLQNFIKDLEAVA